MIKLSMTDISVLAKVAAQEISSGDKVFCVPRGGVPAGYAIGQFRNIQFVNNPDEATVIIDDIIDSGATRSRFPGKKFVALIDKTKGHFEGQWVKFPWESEDEAGGVEDNIRRLIQYVGEDPNRQGLLETPKRVAKAWKDWTSGYGVDPASVLKVFEDGAENYDQMVVRKNIPLYSTCEHHMAAIFGVCTVAYIPNGKVVGLSKMDRLVEIFARRLQVQERLTAQIAGAMQEHLNPLGVGVWISARHMCVESRGCKHQDSETVTQTLLGAFMEDPSVRSEFLALCRN